MLTLVDRLVTYSVEALNITSHSSLEVVKNIVSVASYGLIWNRCMGANGWNHMIRYV